jgi:hypothetical protein
MRRLVAHRPSPAMVVAVIALFMAMGGSAYGLVITGNSIRNGTIVGADIKNGALASRDVKRDSLGGVAIKESRLGTVPRSTLADGIARYAVVTSAGLAARGRGVSSVARTSAGRYQVLFDRDVRSCAFLATIGDAGAAAPPQGEISTSALASNVNAVSVRTENSNGNPADRPFHVAVSC